MRKSTAADIERLQASVNHANATFEREDAARMGKTPPIAEECSCPLLEEALRQLALEKSNHLHILNMRETMKGIGAGSR